MTNMKNETKPQYPIHDLIKKRWSPLAFAAKPITVEELQSLLEAARWAPSSYNEQPWSFILATKDNAAEHQRLLDCLVPANQEWAKNAPVLMLSVASLQFARNGKDNRHAFHDVGLAAENLCLQATSMGLFVHQMAGIEVEKARKTYAIPETHVPVAGIAIGHHGSLEQLSEPLKQRELGERTRKPVNAFVFTGSWGAGGLN